MAIGEKKDFCGNIKLEQFCAYLVKDGTIMITLKERADAVYLEENGKIKMDSWEKPKKVIKKLEHENFDIIVK